MCGCVVSSTLDFDCKCKNKIPNDNKYERATKRKKEFQETVKG